MAESALITFSHQEVVTALIKAQDIHEGLWALYVEFGIGAANVASGPEEANGFLPAAIVPVVKLGIQRADKQTNLSVDAAIANPAA